MNIHWHFQIGKNFQDAILSLLFTFPSLKEVYDPSTLYHAVFLFPWVEEGTHPRIYSTQTGRSEDRQKELAVDSLSGSVTSSIALKFNFLFSGNTSIQSRTLSTYSLRRGPLIVHTLWKETKVRSPEGNRSILIFW